MDFGVNLMCAYPLLEKIVATAINSAQLYLIAIKQTLSQRGDIPQVTEVFLHLVI